MIKERKMFPWEKPYEYEYRNDVGKISTQIGDALRRIEEIAVSGSLDFSELQNIMSKCRRKVRALLPPSMYEESYGFLLEAVDSYSRAMEVLTDAGKTGDKNGVFKAGRLIEEGNSFIQITRSRLWEAIEKKK